MASDQIYIYPTDTVWGIGCDIYSEVGFKEIARIKKTAATKPLSIIFANVEDVMKSISFPSAISKNWLEYFFLQETTLGIPISWAKINIPSWAYQDSEYISLRCLSSTPIKSLYQKIGNPFFTTSLNLQGEDPVLSEADAKKFSDQHCPSAVIIEGTGEIMSGTASSIIFLHENSGIEVRRIGRKINEITAHLNQIRKT